MRRLWLWLVLVTHVLSGCGTTASLTASATPAPSRWTEVVRTPLRVTMPEGRVIALGEDGTVTVDGEATWRLELDGRIVDLEAEPVATLLPDGRISHRRELSSWRIEGDSVLDTDTPIASLEGETLALPSMEPPAHVPVIGVAAESRATLLYVVAVDRLERARTAAALAAAQPDDDRVYYRVPIDGAPSRGGDAALVTIVAFEDFQCPFCSRAEPTLARVLEAYGSDVRIVFRHQPLPFHQNAMTAAEASMEAFAQLGPRGFWAMHDLLFENQRSLDRASLDRYAAQLGLDAARFASALDQHTHRARIEEDMSLGRTLGAHGTPAFFINGVELMGAQPYEEFQSVIDRERERATQLVRAGVARGSVYDVVTRNGRTREAEDAQVAAPTPPRPIADPHAVYAVPVTTQPVLGPTDALATIVIFSDFQCPFCARVEPTLAQLRTQYGNDLRIVWRNNPLPFHANAMPAAEAAMEIYAQTGARGFWAFHDLLFENRETLERADLERMAATIRGVRLPRFRSALDQHTHQAAIEADAALARSLGATGTPSFFINGRNLRGAQPIEAFRTLIDEVLTAARARVASGTPRARVYAETVASGAIAPVF
ncbi:MAG: thioredoxin domain-containing protein, partial [Deltaproteobacteria bacterium]|nr:thioredoxin domain-containing protein [Deltaproteobacteria bacterium]